MECFDGLFFQNSVVCAGVLEWVRRYLFSYRLRSCKTGTVSVLLTTGFTCLVHAQHVSFRGSFILSYYLQKQMSIVLFSEVCKALNKTRGLYRRWLELQDDTANSVSKDELEWTTTELRNALRSIEWDLEDLEDTIDILWVLHRVKCCSCFFGSLCALGFQSYYEFQKEAFIFRPLFLVYSSLWRRKPCFIVCCFSYIHIDLSVMLIYLVYLGTMVQNLFNVLEMDQSYNGSDVIVMR